MRPASETVNGTFDVALIEGGALLEQIAHLAEHEGHDPAMPTVPKTAEGLLGKNRSRPPNYATARRDVHQLG